MKTLITAVALTLASFTSIAASVSFPDSLVVTGINGEKRFDAHQPQLADGENLIQLRYHDIFEVNADDSGAWVKSEPLYLLVDFQGQQEYQAATPTINTEDEAYDFIENPIITLEDAQGKNKTVALLTHQQLMAKVLLTRKN
ncbi:conserved hypothetical protein [Shewanella sediminis HAW-EB3]|uniref:DUF2057 domain-containing protein n=1 Tax=Shewanella sediminis (strain HAW-EB3) TaxID=425104 RepID=A8FPQ4_SHESH|nr:DUF2057 family protein [Shewanella sediminis]ABV34827.1 conserved hypothetical protein [Shewanella sediminis HAW-EB3]